MCYESFTQQKRETDQLEKAKKDADKVIEQARTESRKSDKPAPQMPVAEAEEVA